MLHGKITFKNYFLTILCGLNFLFYFFIFKQKAYSHEDQFKNFQLEPKTINNSIWVGNKTESKFISILILAGHADSQDIEGSGTLGEAVALKNLSRMNESISDELFWNLQVSKEIVRLGKQKGLNIDLYDPNIRTIVDGNNEKTNWSVGAKHALKGGYALEIHFDSYGEYGIGSGLIPPISKNINNIDESLARSFGRYPIFFRGGLGGPRRNIRILEIGKLEGELEANLRNIKTRKNTIEEISIKVIEAIILGLDEKNSFNPQLQKGDIFLPKFYR